MKIHRAEMTGFGPYRGHEVVDFDAFAADGIFLITGRTGAGKTSVLDAVTYALYGRVPRYDAVAGEKVRSDHLGPTDLCEVTLEFSVPAGRYQVVRRPAYQRPKQRGTGLTTVRAFFQLSVLRDGAVEWEVLETKEGNADRFVSDVMPLSAEQFQQVILLAQGQFQEFLVAGSEKRRELLSKLFDTSRFTAYSNDLDERARVLRRELESLSTRVATHASTLARQVGTDVPDHVEVSTGAGLSEWAADVLAAQAARLATARVERDEATAAWERDRAGLEQAQQLLDRQLRRRQADERHHLLLQDAPQVEEARRLVEVARRAALVAQARRSRDLREAELGEAGRLLGVAVTEAADAWPSGDAETVPLVELRAEVESLAAALVGMDEAAAAERSLPTLVQAAVSARAAVERFDEQRTALDQQRVAATEELDRLTARCADLEVALVALADAPVARDAAQEGRDAARALEELTRERATALRRQAEAQREVVRTAGALSDLLDRQLAEYAGVLAAELVGGSPCQVCGSADHPAPAELVDGHVDEEALTAARDTSEWAAKRAQEADAVVVRLDTRRTVLEEAAAGRDAAAWSQELDAGVERCAQLQQTRDQLAQAKDVMTSLRQSLDRLARTVEDEQDRRSELMVAQAAADDALERVTAQVEQARGAHDTVGERRAECHGRRTRLTALVARREGIERADTALASATSELDAVLEEQGFSSAEEAQGSFRPQEEVARLEARVRRHDADLEGVRQVLAAPELQGLPDEPADVEPWQVACAASRERHAAALQAFGSAEQLHATVTAVAGRIEQDLTGSASVRREYDLVNSLAATLRGQGQNERRMALESFALAAELEEIVASANRRLERMTHGRFTFLHSDTEESRRVASGLGLDVLDAHTGESRSPRSLSGGEKFQASLALALGLAEVVTARAGGLRLDTLFIDEGFGTLDPETLEATMATLDGLREGGRTIGLISHVTALKESIPCQVHVETTPGGWSTIRHP